MFGQTTKTNKTTLTLGSKLYEWSESDTVIYESSNPIAETWEDGNQIEEVYWDYDQNKMTSPVRKENYLYDGNEITVKNYSWVEGDGDWQLSSYCVLETDGAGSVFFTIV